MTYAPRSSQPNREYVESSARSRRPSWRHWLSRLVWIPVQILGLSWLVLVFGFITSAIRPLNDSMMGLRRYLEAAPMLQWADTKVEGALLTLALFLVPFALIDLLVCAVLALRSPKKRTDGYGYTVLDLFVRPIRWWQSLMAACVGPLLFLGLVGVFVFRWIGAIISSDNPAGGFGVMLAAGLFIMMLIGITRRVGWNQWGMWVKPNPAMMIFMAILAGIVALLFVLALFVALLPFVAVELAAFPQLSEQGFLPRLLAVAVCFYIPATLSWLLVGDTPWRDDELSGIAGVGTKIGYGLKTLLSLIITFPVGNISLEQRETGKTH